jgi:type 1 fimbriae regulatory protein FimE
MSISVHSHMFRYAYGYKHAQAEQETRAIKHNLGHRNIQLSVRYTQLSLDRFKVYWKD